MIYIVEHEGRIKPLEEITASEFRRVCDPIVRMIERRLADDTNFNDLQIVFSVDPDEGLKFAFRGDPVVVNAAVDRLGNEARVHGFDA